MSADIVVPAQIRAARALLEWSQEELAAAAGVSLSTVRDIEGQRRALDTASAVAIRRALENGGAAFVSGTSKAGPGVRFVANRPHVIQPPTTMTMWDGLPFVVEWQGKSITVFVRREAMDDLGRFRTKQTDAAYLKIYEKYRGSILDGVARALEMGRADAQGRLGLTGDDIPALS